MNNIEDYGGLYNVLNDSKAIQIYANESNPNQSVVIRGLTNAMIGLAVFSIMWNSLLLTFLLPIFFKQLKMKKLIVFTFVIWLLAISKFVFHVGDIDISKQVVVIEAKDNIH